MGQEREGRGTAKGPPWRPVAPDDAWGSSNRSIGIRTACNQRQNTKKYGISGPSEPIQYPSVGEDARRTGSGSGGNTSIPKTSHPMVFAGQQYLKQG